jgi:hypothetical protein
MRIDSVTNFAYTENVASTGRTAAVHEAPQNKTQQTPIAPPEDGLTGAERAFFAKLFPGSVHQIGPRETYTPVGMNAQVELGQIVNRKG